MNVARVIRELGGEAIAVYLAGGLTGQAFTQMIDAIGLQHRAIPIHGYTRVCAPCTSDPAAKSIASCRRGRRSTRTNGRRVCASWRASSSIIPRRERQSAEGVPDDFYARLAQLW